MDYRRLQHSLPEPDIDVTFWLSFEKMQLSNLEPSYFRRCLHLISCLCPDSGSMSQVQSAKKTSTRQLKRSMCWKRSRGMQPGNGRRTEQNGSHCFSGMILPQMNGTTNMKSECLVMWDYGKLPLGVYLGCMILPQVQLLSPFRKNRDRLI